MSDYRTETLELSAAPDADAALLNARLSALSQEGWDLVGMLPYDAADHRTVMLTLRRRTPLWKHFVFLPILVVLGLVIVGSVLMLWNMLMSSLLESGGV